jgi:hypothetical protein
MDCLVVDWFYSQSLHERSTVERVAGVFKAALQELIAR